MSVEAAGRRDLIIVNSCAVTGESVAQARQRIRRLAREVPHKRNIVTGCAAQTERGGLARAADFTPMRLQADLPPGELHMLAASGHDGQKLVQAGG